MSVGEVGEYISALKESPRFGVQVVHHEEISGSEARFADLAQPLPENLARALSFAGFQNFYRHQALAIDAVRSGRDVVVATPTASGKSLIYNVPVFEAIMTGGGRALYLFPLKALAQDQLKALERLVGEIIGAKIPAAAICDGDTSSYRRKKIRENPPDILITNPDMLHLSMLPYHDRWAGLFADLTHIVIDEVHTYRGVFGSHMAWVLRRLIRICEHYGSRPSVIMSSATIANPGGLAADLLGREVLVVDGSGAPRAGQHFIIMDPHDSASHAACQLLEAALKRGLRTIVYTQSRKMTELISVWTRTRLGDLASKLSSYRAGFLPEERREIEERLTSGELLGVVSTSALELGIDIGELDICILVGYPGSIMATWQRGGRVGRRGRDSLIVMIGHEDALDQYFMRNPREFFNRKVEAAVVNPANPEIVKRHLVCAAAEIPLESGEDLLKPETVSQSLLELSLAGELLKGDDDERWFAARKYPHRDVDLRGSGRGFAIRQGREDLLLGQIDGGRALKECHPGAVYLHGGQLYVVESLDLEGREVRVIRKDVNYFTRSLANKETEIFATLATTSFVPRNGMDFSVSYGRLRVTDTVTGFQRRLVRGQRLVSTERLELPPLTFETEGLWIDIPEALRKIMEDEQRHFMGGIHALEHTLIGIFPLLVLCDRNDVGGIAYPDHPQRPGSAVFIYDGHSGGVGLCRQAFAAIPDLLQAGRETVQNCPCEVGCPSCVHSPKCGSGNRPIDKAAALRLFEGLLGDDDQGLVGRVEIVSVNAEKMIPESPEVEAGEGALSDRFQGRYAVFDVETRRSAAEVGGWHRAERMGISVVVLYDSGEDQFFDYRDDEIGELVSRLRQVDLVVGFNNKRFDNRVLSAYTRFDLASLPTLDLLEEVKNRLGYRLSLDRLAEHTLGVQKTADGLMALKWYKEGRIDKIIEYCRQDVAITRDLYLFGRENGFLLFRNKAGKKVRCPVTY
ncbi:MAG: DEAD/DEAH box helicase [Proteobacteria bacterium]|nr:DEAD/DEAH box helicase [Pseudomonadota bacterium]MBU1688844.1 DEAD/DEAH box helicase [Pseudomonadota bacterium]